jgi:hypothetical protein
MSIGYATKGFNNLLRRWVDLAMTQFNGRLNSS